MDNDTMCLIPLSATIKKINGKMEIVSADWQEIPADVIARFLIKKFGITPIFGGENED